MSISVSGIQLATNDTILAKSRYRTLLWAGVLGSLAGLLFGYDTNVLSGALIYLSVDLGFHSGGLTSWDQGLVTSVLLLGAAITAFFGGQLADRTGRRNILRVGAFLFLVGAVASVVAPNFNWLVISRFILGCGLGITSTVVPIYLSEIAPAASRGRLIASNAVMINVGQLIAVVANACVSPFASWRLMFILAAIPAVLVMIAVCFIGDTPNWYVRHNQNDKARKALLKTSTAEQTEQFIAKEQAMMALESESGKQGQLSDFFREKWLQRVLFVGVIIALINQFTGINAVMYFTPTLLTTVGLSAQNALLASVPIVLLGTAAAVGLGFGLMDRAPRRLVLGIGTTGVAITMAAIGWVYGLIDPSNPSVLISWVLIALMALFLIINQGFVGAMTWTILAEIFPGHLRGLGNGLATAIIWVVNFGISLVVLPLLNSIGGRWVFWIFAVINIFAALFVWKVLPETRGKSLDAIENEFRTRVEN